MLVRMLLLASVAVGGAPQVERVGADGPAAASSAGANASAANTSTSAIVDGQLRVDGAPFFVVGMYVHNLAAADWAWMKAAGMNTVLTYTNGLSGEESNKTMTPANLTTIGRFLDTAQDHGIKVFLCLKDLYPTHNKLSAAANVRIVTAIVTAVRDHPALLGWYVNDEYKVYYLPMLEERARLLATLDPHHILYSVEDTGNTTRLKEYRNTSTLFGVDPYPWSNATLTPDIHQETEEVDALMAAFAGDDEVASCTVFQIFSWAPFDCKRDPPKCWDSWPPYEVMRAMAFLQPVRGSTGLLQYAYYAQFGYPGKALPRTEPAVAARLATLAKLGLELAGFAAAEFLARPAQRTVLSVTGGPTTPAGDATVWATLFKCDHGCSDKGTLIVVNGNSLKAKVAVALPSPEHRQSGSGAAAAVSPVAVVIELEPWGVVAQRL